MLSGLSQSILFGRSSRVIAGSAVIALFLSACSTGPKAPVANKAADKPDIVVEDPAQQQIRAQEQAEITRLQKQDPDLYQQYRDNPKTLVGHLVLDMKAAFGFPDQTRRETNVTIYQYVSEKCVLDVFAKLDRDLKQIVYVETRDREGYRMPAAACEISS